MSGNKNLWWLMAALGIGAGGYLLYKNQKPFNPETDLTSGWAKDPWDYQAVYHQPITLAIPDVFDLGAFIPPVGNQGSVSSCVAWAVGEAITTNTIQRGFFYDYFSKTWLYNGARMMTDDLIYDIGTYPGAMFRWIKQYGLLYSQYWPYSKSFDPNPPTPQQYAQAFHFPNFQDYRVSGGAEGLCQAIADGHVVTLGASWFREWLNVPKLGILPEISLNSIEVCGHETLLYGYDKTRGYFHGMNSWGPWWGDNGHFWMPFSALPVMLAFWGYDLNYVTFDDVDAGIIVHGSVWEANGQPLSEATVYVDYTARANSGADGAFQINMMPGEHVFEVYKAGYRNQYRKVVVNEQTVLDFKGDTSLVPNAPDMAYVLACVNKWKYPPADGTALTMSKVQAVVNAWKFPV